jgi:hypothetical protein
MERWRFAPTSGSHVLKLHYNPVDGFLYGVLWAYEDGRFRRLLRLDPRDGRCEQICSLGSWDEAFGAVGQQLITSSGDIIALATGQVTGSLAFPRMETSH